ncbi:hypothetical protein GCM10009646_24790 [Streptomyces aureus]
MVTAVRGRKTRMRDLLRASRPGYGTAVIGAAWGTEAYRNVGVGRLRLILFGVVAGALDGPKGGVLPGVVEEHGAADEPAGPVQQGRTVRAVSGRDRVHGQGGGRKVGRRQDRIDPRGVELAAPAQVADAGRDGGEGPAESGPGRMERSWCPACGQGHRMCPSSSAATGATGRPEQTR